MHGVKSLALAGGMLAWAVAAGPACAAPNADAQKIDACLTAASEKGESGVTCIGIVADPCITAAKGKNSDWPDSKACAARELAVWTARLQAAIKSANGGGKEIAALVAGSQTPWTQSLTRLCPRFDNLDPGTVMGGANYCRMQETAMRTLVIERLALSVNEH